MAKNMHNTAYRKVNVDVFDPEQYDENDDLNETPGLGPDERSVESYLSMNQNQQALHTALANPPLQAKDQATKERATLLVAKVLASFKTSEIESVVKSLNDDEGDILMKYVFKAMEITPESALCQNLLTFHSQLVARFGLAVIIRVLADRKRL